MWGHHLAFGRPFLDETCRIRLPDGLEVIPHETPIHPGGRRVKAGHRPKWPVAEGAEGEIVYLAGIQDGEAWYEVEHPGTGTGFRVEWDVGTMPYLWYWQEFGASQGYPWYGRHYNIGLEPFSSYPTDGLAAAVQNGTALAFGPREQKGFWLRASVIEATGQR